MSYQVIFREPNDAKLLNYQGVNPRVENVDGMEIHRDVVITMRDGIKIYADVYFPQNHQGNLPCLLSWSPYGKHGAISLNALPGHEIDPNHISKHYIFESCDPLYWVNRGYAVILPEPRGSWGSEGKPSSCFGTQETEDEYDVIEWAGVQPWSNGNVGLIGQSYFSVTQWKVAALNPPHLKCIAPWGGFSRGYNLGYNGGICNDVFMRGMNLLTGYSALGVAQEDWVKTALTHPFDDEYWANKTADLSKITIPAYVVADWTDLFLHSPGTIDGYLNIASTDKWLQINGGKKWAEFVKPEQAARLAVFYDKYLKNTDADLSEWSPVRIEVREKTKVSQWRDEQEWPLARTQYRQLFLTDQQELSDKPLTQATSVRYQAECGEVIFNFPIEKDTELTGSMKLKLWVEVNGSNDMDLFVGVRKLDHKARPVHFPLLSILDNGEAALGCLRVSQRHLDKQKSTTYRPYHTNDREELLQEGEIVPIEIEVWPSSTLFKAGETLQLVVRGFDICLNDFRLAGIPGHTQLRNQGMHIIHLGGEYDSHLSVPVVE